MEKINNIKRFAMLIEKLEKNHFPSMQDFMDYFSSSGYSVSQRTIERDIEKMRNDFGLEVEYKSTKNGYYIDYDASINVSAFFRYLEIATTAELFNATLGDGQKTLAYVSFDEGGGLKGINNLKPILAAIKDHHEITFDHYSFGHDKLTPYQVKPYLLKEYLNRWYLAGVVTKTGKVRTFGLDRIRELQVTTSVFKKDKKVDPKQNFENTIGLVYSQHKQQKVVLSFTPYQGKYIETLPLHWSQKVLVNDDSEYRIQINVTPNHELKQIILKYAEEVKVVEPKWLVEEIKEHHKQSLERYL